VKDAYEPVGDSYNPKDFFKTIKVKLRDNYCQFPFLIKNQRTLLFLLRRMQRFALVSKTKLFFSPPYATLRLGMA
jgi:hypothetical protein